MGGLRVAVMQPYFYPYAGYFRLFAAADCFVILDCVQFNRRGRVHRAPLRDAFGNDAWLTLPLARQPREVAIRDLAFATGARAELDDRLQRAGWGRQVDTPLARQVHAHLHGSLGTVVDFLEAGLRLVAGALGFRPTLLRSSSLGLPSTLKGQARIIGIVQAIGGTEYINPPGGHHLYDPAAFSAAGLGLSFLDPYQGRHHSLLQSLAQASAGELRADVLGALGATGSRGPVAAPEEA